MKRQLSDSVYEFQTPDGDFDVELVFFHGLCFSEYADAYETTWRVEDGIEGTRCWLRDLVPKTFPGARILAVSYDSCARVSDRAGRMSFSNLGIILVQDLIHLAKVGQRNRPVVLVGYCLGGLVIKQLCTEAERQLDYSPDGASKGRLDQFLTNVRANVFLDTPHAGTDLAKYLKKKEKCDGPVLEYLDSSSASLGHLNSNFESLATEREWEPFSCWYFRKTLVWSSVKLSNSGLQVVQEESARRGQGRFFCVDADHSGKASSGRRQLEQPLDQLEGFVADVVSKTKLPHSQEAPVKIHTCPTLPRVKYDQLNDSLHEIYRPKAEVKMELLFFPGPQGKDGYKATWMTEDSEHCWLEDWLPEAFPEARIWTVSYDLAEIDPELISENLITTLILSRSYGWCPMILVGHCVGGLVIKEFCSFVENKIGKGENSKRLQEFLGSVRGIAFYGTPHSGYTQSETSRLSVGAGEKKGSANPSEPRFWSGRAVGRLNSGYMRCVSSFGWKELALGETHPTQQGSRKSIIVDEFSASNGIQRNSFFPIAADHLSLCKPKSPTSNCFQYLVHFIHTTMNEAQYANMNVRRKKRRGIALLIGMEKKRDGSEADRYRVESMADYLHFDFVPVIDIKASKIQHKLEEILAGVNETDECIVCCVDAHGEVLDGIHFIYDNEGDGIELLSKILKPISDCDLLAGKPKVFVVNSCREIRGGTEPTSSNSQEQNDLEGKEDCLLMYSCKLNTQSYRAETGYEKGTFFIIELTYHISLSYQTTDVQDIFKKVEKKVQELAARMKVDQCPVIYSSLKKRLSWRLK
ncbi:hypothetical protein MARPO_0108s0037 [Marchantia polymorpha]|uniref:Caspase family p20 domain-containing protein n=1 Tax=Marchantia polymorpha TaxID=3197 RepID=A0A2R6WCW2_MARPO|nr:hypothetical protein MARPO_0108s0037 [Marchantia polymorpha]|eukprot:PTQ31690.1 hypothetical protein MARPO_0108s0037 [Marchantia polymorpha]